MKFTLVTLLSVFGAAVAAAPVIKSNSVVGKNILSKARKLEQNANEEIDFNWVSDYSVKFQGCQHIKQWNDEADDENDVRIQTQRLVRFRLCPSDQCSATKGAGCSKGYGDYVIDMDSFMESYFEAKRQQLEAQCEYTMNYVCNCDDDDGKDDGFNAEYCEYDCFVANDLAECVDRNPYEEDNGEQQEEFNVEEYMECAQVELNNNNGRKLNQEEEVQYFVGPHCAEQGGGITLGLFTDDACTIFAEDVTYQELTGMVLPYAEKSIVDAECLSCMEVKDDNGNDNNQNDQADEDLVSESCERLYQSAGKCESNLASGVVDEPNYNACTYMEGIRVVRQDGIVDTGSSRPSAVATAFIVIFAMAFAAMGFYVWYLRTRLGVKQNALL